MEHVARGKNRLARHVQPYLATGQKAIYAQHLLTFGIPDNELIIGILARVELIEVQAFPSSAPGGPESNLTQTAYLSDYTGRLFVGHDVDLVIALIGRAQSPVWGQFRF